LNFNTQAIPCLSWCIPNKYEVESQTDHTAACNSHVTSTANTAQTT